MSKHTPGPWEVVPLIGKYYGTHVSLPGGGVIEVWTGGSRPKEPSEREIAEGWTPDIGMDHVESAEDFANARLIAASPELIEACQTFAEWLRLEDEGFPDAAERRKTSDGEADWREWWIENMRLCELAQKQARAAIAKATGEQV